MNPDIKMIYNTFKWIKVRYDLEQIDDNDVTKGFSNLDEKFPQMHEIHQEFLAHYLNAKRRKVN